MTRSERTAREVAYRTLQRIDDEGAYANLALRAALDRSGLDLRDRRFVTELVYGTTRMRRACDFLFDRFLRGDVEPEVRSLLRLGAYQLHFAGVSPHAAVSATVDLAAKRVRGLVNAVLRRVADAPVEWPSDAVRLSYPDWVFDRLVVDLGYDDAVAAMVQMNEPATATIRDDDYVQDEASQWVAQLVEAQPGERVADVCAAPGGKATLLAEAGAWVAAADIRPRRSGLVKDNASKVGVGSRLAVLTADATATPFRPGTFDRVLVDAPCSGLGTLRRRADARWRLDEAAVDRLATLQRRMVDAAVELLRPGGVLVYSACTLTRPESLGVDEHLARLEALPPPGDPWQPWGRGALVLPQAAGTDGMFILRLRS